MSGLPSLTIVDDERFDAHTARGPHPERPERLLAARSGLRRGLGDAPTDRVPTRPATRAEV
ncbi:MAG TPA: histone deacetylase, partial [Sandaracinaceae bacterium LLY-WYZ-13_1]|nr:histone deacetylase [Sandaracinaceae bacterium LLY-WYZ-13_1]